MKSPNMLLLSLYHLLNHFGEYVLLTHMGENQVYKGDKWGFGLLKGGL